MQGNPFVNIILIVVMILGAMFIVVHPTVLASVLAIILVVGLVIVVFYYVNKWFIILSLAGAFVYFCLIKGIYLSVIANNVVTEIVRIFHGIQ